MSAGGGSSNSGNGSSGGAVVGWQVDGVVDLELEARLKGLSELLPGDIRLQVRAGALECVVASYVCLP
jgi:hypothetical protein